MTEEQAKTKLQLMVLSDEDPTLSDDQLNDLVARARRPDSEGRTYGETDWEPTWDLDSAAAEGWQRKAGIAANRFSFSEEGQQFQRAQIYAHCVSQAQYYSRRSMGNIPASSDAA